MKSFIKNVFANIVAIFIIGIVGFIILISFIAMASAGDSGDKITKNSVLTIDYNTHIIDSPTEDEESILNMKENIKNVMIYDMLKAIEKAKTDENIKGISIETDMISAGITQIDNIREALEDFKKSGKFVLAYGNNVSQTAFYLGSVADQYYLHPAGGIELKGLSAEVVFLKDFTEKYGITPQILRYGKYKSAVEPFLRNNLSEENKEQISTMLNDIWQKTSEKIAKSRKIETQQFQNIVDSLYAIIPDNNIKYRLADKLIQKSEYDNILKTKLKLDKDENLNRVSFSSYIESIKTEYQKDKIAILYASGEINNGKGYDNIYSETLIKDIKKLADDETIKAVVLRINSPGGSANASDEILFELNNLKKKKPLIVSFGDYAASGGYYIAMAADKIYSEPNTLTGSIGVFGVIPNVKGLANQNGITSETVNTNANSNMHSLINGLSAGAETILTKNVEQTYKRFVHFVTQNRKQTFEQIDAAGGGRVWSGSRAKSLGLVDELGTINDALKFAANKAKVSQYEVEAYPKKKTAIEQFFGTTDDEDIYAKIIKAKMGKQNYKIYQQLTNPKVKNQILMEMPFEINL